MATNEQFNEKNLLTDEFRLFLQQELIHRCKKNPRYSLRAFAKSLGLDHGSLSSMINGKRSITNKTKLKISKAIGLSPDQMLRFGIMEDERHAKDLANSQVLHQLSLDVFTLISEWYHDAILELIRVKGFQANPRTIARMLGLSVNEVNAAVERLQRLNLLTISEDGKWIDISGDNTIIHGRVSTGAKKNYQKQILFKALEAIDHFPFDIRDQSSISFAISKKDLPEAFSMIKKFRRELSNFLQRKGVEYDSVYQLSISLFPLTKLEEAHS